MVHLEILTYCAALFSFFQGVWALNYLRTVAGGGTLPFPKDRKFANDPDGLVKYGVSGS